MPIGVEEELERRPETEARPRLRILHRLYSPMNPPGPATGPEQRVGLLHPGEPATCRREWRRFLPILLNLGLILAVFQAYRLEGLAFRRLVALALAALPFHYLLPYRFKKPFFVAISLVGLWLVFGTSTALLVLPAAVLLIGLTTLPVSWGIRAALIAAVGTAMAFARAHTFGISTLEIALPLLGSMFIFRMMIYLYELKHAKTREPIIDALSYFLVLPNFCFLHFPVVDYRTMQRGYFASDIHALQRTGLRMMFNGTVQLLCYRLVYHDLVIAAEEVRDPLSLVVYLVGNYLLYLHVSGQFHLACGMLHLFGFQLPQTHHNYLLATGFTDYWRRINIYWKDFMVRIVFNPIVFRLKRWPMAVALSFATGCVFVTTWALHALQSFWLRGVWGFSLHDALFWGILGVFVIVNVQFDARRCRAKPRTQKPTIRDGAVHVFKIAAMFTAITLLWSLWYSAGVASWLATFRRAFAGE